MDAAFVERRLARIRPGGRGEFLLSALAANASLSRTSEGAPALVFVLDDVPSLGPLRSVGLELSFHPAARVRRSGKVATRSIAVLRCVDERRLHEFAVVAADVAQRLESYPGLLVGSAGILSHFYNWAELFKAEAVFERQRAIGLFGELLLLASMSPADVAVTCWHGPEALEFDFGGNGQYVEVKTSTRGHAHTFGLAQLTPPAGTSLRVASICLRRDPAAGSTLTEMVEAAHRRLSNPLALEKKLLLLGWTPFNSPDDRWSVEEVKLYEGTSIPRPIVESGLVQNVRFDVDLAAIEPLAETASDVLAELVGEGPRRRARKPRTSRRAQ